MFDQAAFVEHQEHLLVPAVVVDVRGREEPSPVVRVPHPLLVGADAGDVAMSDRVRVPALLLGRVLGGHPERVVSHRVEHVAPHQAVEAGHGIADRVVADVPHVHAAGGIGEHLEAVELGLGVVDFGFEGPGIRPRLLPAGLYLLRVVCHFLTPIGLRREPSGSPQKQ